MSYRAIPSLIFLLLLSMPAQAHPESFHIIVDVSVTVLVQLVLFGLFSLMFRGRQRNDSLWLGLYGATLVFSILATTEVRQLYPMWIVPVVIYALMFINYLKSSASPENEANQAREQDAD